MSQQIESVKMALQELGINASGEFYYNPDYDLLIAHETSPELTGAARGVMTDSGAVYYTHLRAHETTQPEKPGRGPAERQKTVRHRRLVRRQPGHPSWRTLRHRGGVAGPLCQKHVYRAKRRRAGQLYARLRGAQRRGLHQCQLAGAGDELRELCRL